MAGEEMVYCFLKCCGVLVGRGDMVPLEDGKMGGRMLNISCHYFCRCCQHRTQPANTPPANTFSLTPDRRTLDSPPTTRQSQRLTCSRLALCHSPSTTPTTKGYFPCSYLLQPLVSHGINRPSYSRPVCVTVQYRDPVSTFLGMIVLMTRLPLDLEDVRWSPAIIGDLPGHASSLVLPTCSQHANSSLHESESVSFAQDQEKRG
ncbi:hypothetical protein F4778DRAFT_600377 [Xylariomycetidae sp. FL2044]|nr:hypothetical protein F4778DRAFT_600377 [Xylariomycetidae sp. FL2044]